VGFEIRDQLMWLYASGFPKAQDVGKAIQRRLGVEEYEEFVDTTKNAGFGQTDHARVRAGVEWSTKETQVGKAKCTSPEAQQWEGWKTALKPAHEPIVMARKPFRGSTIDNVLSHGVGALNIDATRIAFEDEKDIKTYRDNIGGPLERSTAQAGDSIGMHEGRTGFRVQKGSVEDHMVSARYPSNVMGEVTGYQKFFYSPKVSRKERHCGFENALTERQKVEAIGAYYCDAEGVRVEQSAFIQHPTIGLTQVKGITKLYDEWLKTQNKDPLSHIPPTHTKDHGAIKHTASENNRKLGNNHPTVKPVALMRYLIELVAPKNSTILDPFTGSGSTGMAACELGHQFVGCELDPNYVTIAKRRIEGWIHSEGKPKDPNLPRMCGPGGKDWVKSQSHQGNNPVKKPNPQDLFEDAE
jgi:site-specific DNA-methyltransferase (adenine-specific)